MPLSPDKQEALKQATIEYLRTLTLIHVWDQRDARIGIEYQQYCLMRAFTSQAKDGPHGLFAPIEALEKYLSQIGDIGEGRINLSSVNKVIEGLCSDFNVVPLDPKAIDSLADKAVEWFNQAYDYSTTVFIPLANVRMSHDVPEIALGRATLHRGYSHSEMMGYVHQLAPKTEFNVEESTCYLKIAATGDAESIEQYVLTETENALRVLRFVSWTSSTLKGTKRISHNQARDVSYYPCHTPAGYYFYLNRKGEPHNGYLVNTTTPSVYLIDRGQVAQFQLYGLNDLNGHFVRENNPLSDQVLLALEWYDSGLQAKNNREALYRFLVSMNAVFAWGNEKQNKDLDGSAIQKRIRKLLIETGSDDGTTVFLDFWGDLRLSKSIDGIDVTTLTIPVIELIAANYAGVFKVLFLEQRNRILHGLPHQESRVAKFDDVRNARLLAQNTIRLVLKIIADNPTWTTRDDVENWFTT